MQIMFGILLYKTNNFTLHTFVSISCSISCTSFISKRSRTEILFEVSGLDDEPSFFNFLVSVIIVKLIVKPIFVVCLLSSKEIYELPDIKILLELQLSVCQTIVVLEHILLPCQRHQFVKILFHYTNIICCFV